MHNRCSQPVNSSKMSGPRAVAAMLRAVCMVPIARPGSKSASYVSQSAELAGRRFVSSGGPPRHILGGRSIFALKATAAPAADEATTSSAPIIEPMELPTSDESDKLLRIRHSVSMGSCMSLNLSLIHLLGLKPSIPFAGMPCTAMRPITG